MRKLFVIMLLWLAGLAPSALASHVIQATTLENGVKIMLDHGVCSDPTVALIIAMSAPPEMQAASWYAAVIDYPELKGIGACWMKYEADGKPAVFLVDAVGNTGYIFTDKFKPLDNKKQSL